MTSHSNAPARLMRIVAIAIMIAMLAVPAMAAPQAAPAAPTSTNPVTTVTLVSPTTAVPFYFPAGVAANFNITYSADGLGSRFCLLPGRRRSGRNPASRGSLPVTNGTLAVTLPAADSGLL